jgi:hypothetical protein
VRLKPAVAGSWLVAVGCERVSLLRELLLRELLALACAGFA